MWTLVKFVPLHLLFLMAGLISPPSAHAKHATPTEVEVWILDYDDLERLTPENRAKYLLGLRDVIVEFEKSSEDGLVAATHEGFWQEVWSGFGLPAATAATAADCKHNEEFVASRFCRAKALFRTVQPDYDCNLVPVDPLRPSGNRAYSCQRAVGRASPRLNPARREPPNQTPIPVVRPDQTAIPPEFRAARPIV